MSGLVRVNPSAKAGTASVEAKAAAKVTDRFIAIILSGACIIDAFILTVTWLYRFRLPIKKY